LLLLRVHHQLEDEHQPNTTETSKVCSLVGWEGASHTLQMRLTAFYVSENGDRLWLSKPIMCGVSMRWMILMKECGLVARYFQEQLTLFTWCG